MPERSEAEAPLEVPRGGVTNLANIAEMWQHMRAIRLDGQLKALHRKSVTTAAAAVLLDWSIILLAFESVWTFGWWAVPVALVAIGNRQRALVVLIHDASHYLLHPSRRINDWVAQVALCWPIFASLHRYRKLHNQHHLHLGDPALDTDFLHDENVIRRGSWAVYSAQAFNRRSLRSALVGMVGHLTWRQRGPILLWWITVLFVIGTVLNPWAAAIFGALWIAARITVQHLTISFVIISDHVGLTPGTVMGFTRNHPPNSPITWLLHPHGNGWHLTHHLLPGVPFYRLRDAHRLLKTWPSYAEAEHCESYFLGPRSVIESWCRLNTCPASEVETSNPLACSGQPDRRSES
ncbi:fatty acid desaturase family protein [Bradyrhizobium sp. SZCCHNS1054]|uniref:fatty acid desaturase family protein n=1 Tax=Bradyrhizobium sp. SZCCHNS1054 TaxID=3057301 RepID=UPI00291712FE|nr:fatty acid desaturase [Bradyrhizobium sp. SZCCHNS1054]